MADDKEGVPPDPWADLEANGAGDAGDAFDFSFEGVESIESPIPEEPPLVEPDVLPQEVFEVNEAAMPSEEVAFDQEPAIEPTAMDEALPAEEPEPQEMVEEIALWLQEPVADQGVEPEADVAAFGTDGSDAVDSAEVVGYSADPVDAGDVYAETLDPEPVAEPIPDDWLAPAAEGGVADETFETAFAPDDGSGNADASDTPFGGFGIEDAVAPAVAETAFGDALEDAAATAAVIPSAVIPRVAPSPARRKKTGGGAMGAVIGGLLSIPIVFFILLGVFWATGRDPLGFRSWLPRFMLPSGARAAVREVAASRVEPLGSRPSLDQVAIGESGADEQPSIDEPAEEDPAAIDPSDMDERSATDEFAASEKSTEAIIDDLPADRKSTRLNSSHERISRMPTSA